MLRTEAKYPELGQCITRFIRMLAALRDQSVGLAMQDVAQRTGRAVQTVYCWRAGNLWPSNEALEILAQLGRQEAGLDRVWVEQLLEYRRNAADQVDDVLGHEPDADAENAQGSVQWIDVGVVEVNG